MEENRSYLGRVCLCVLIVLGLFVFLYSMIENNKTAVRVIQQQISFFDVVEDLSNTLLVPASCIQSLSGQTLGEPIAILVSGYSQIKAGSHVGDIEFKEVNLKQTGKVPGVKDEFMAKVEFKVSLAGGKEIIRSIPLQVKVSGNSVLECQGSGYVSLGQVCDSLSGSFNSKTQRCSELEVVLSKNKELKRKMANSKVPPP